MNFYLVLFSKIILIKKFLKLKKKTKNNCILSPAYGAIKKIFSPYDFLVYFSSTKPFNLTIGSFSSTYPWLSKVEHIGYLCKKENVINRM